MSQEQQEQETTFLCPKSFWCPNLFSDRRYFWTQNFLGGKNSFQTKNFSYPNLFEPRIFMPNFFSSDQIFFRTHNLLRPTKISGHKIFFSPQNYFQTLNFFRLNIFLDPKWTSMKDNLWMEKTELLNLRLS